MYLKISIIKMVQKTLLSALETVISLMMEVELQEKAAEQAKQDAANGGLEMLKRVEDLKQMLQHAKEANDMVVFFLLTAWWHLSFDDMNIFCVLCLKFVIVVAACRRSIR